MRRSEFEVKDEAAIEALLAECEYGTLSLVDDGEPYGVPVNFVWFGGYGHDSRGDERKMRSSKCDDAKAPAGGRLRDDRRYKPDIHKDDGTNGSLEADALTQIAESQSRAKSI